MFDYRGWLRRAAKEPFVHFLLLGVLVFAFNAWRDTRTDLSDRHIVVTQADVQRLVALYMQTWNHPPSPADVDALIRDHVKEEIYYREALRMGLDKNDEVVRRRMRSKMEFLAVTSVDAETPDGKTLLAFMQTHPEKYGGEPRYSFRTVYEGVGASARAAALHDLASAHGNADLKGAGQRIDAPAALAKATKADIAAAFGQAFANAVAKAPVGRWAGPFESSFGLNLVRVAQVAAPAPLSLAQVRRDVENDWRAETLAKREAAGYQALLDGYDVKIEKPQ
ncbi:MAG: peptidylprolyl isomerase [Pseudomonadota bacterium]|jgi:peptidyl-prolyl cis-trans isomerase C